MDWREYTFQKFEPEGQTFEIKSVFIKEQPVKDGKARQPYKIASIPSFMYFENLPVGYDEKLMQYEYSAFAFTNCQLKQDYQAGELLQITDPEINEIIQLI
jgi:CRISPR-associated protein Cas5h